MRPGDQIIEIKGVDMTCANPLQVNIAFLALDRGAVPRKAGKATALPRF